MYGFKDYCYPQMKKKTYIFFVLLKSYLTVKFSVGKQLDAYRLIPQPIGGTPRKSTGTSFLSFKYSQPTDNQKHTGSHFYWQHSHTRDTRMAQRLHQSACSVIWK